MAMARTLINVRSASAVRGAVTGAMIAVAVAATLSSSSRPPAGIEADAFSAAIDGTSGTTVVAEAPAPLRYARLR